MEKSSFAIEPGILSFSQQNWALPTFTVVETLPNGDQLRHRMNEAGDSFCTEAEAQLWIINRNS